MKSCNEGSGCRSMAWAAAAAGGDAAEMKFMECCRYLWQAEGAELIEPFIEAVFNKLPDKSRCVLFQRMLTIVYLAQDAEPTPPE